MSWIKRHYGKKFSLSRHSLKGVAKRGVVGPQNVLYWKHSSHTLAESAWQKYEKEIKGIFMQHSQQELTSQLKVLYWRGLSVRLHLGCSTKTSFCVWQRGWQHFGMKKKKNMIETERDSLINHLKKNLKTSEKTLWPHQSESEIEMDFPCSVKCVLLHSYTNLCVCLHSCWRAHSSSFCVCTTRYWKPWEWSSKQLLFLL